MEPASNNYLRQKPDLRPILAEGDKHHVRLDRKFLYWHDQRFIVRLPDNKARQKHQIAK